MSTEPERLLTVDEVATRLNLHPETIRRYLQRGLLKGVKFGNRGGWRIKEADLDDFMRRLQADETMPNDCAA